MGCWDCKLQGVDSYMFVQWCAHPISMSRAIKYNVTLSLADIVSMRWSWGCLLRRSISHVSDNFTILLNFS
jgi:hypothetical protein